MAELTAEACDTMYGKHLLRGNLWPPALFDKLRLCHAVSYLDVRLGSSRDMQHLLRLCTNRCDSGPGEVCPDACKSSYQTESKNQHARFLDGERYATEVEHASSEGQQTVRERERIDID